MTRELQVLTQSTDDLINIYDALSKEVDALRDLGHIESCLATGGEMLVLQLLQKEELLLEFPLPHVLRMSIIEGIRMFDEMLIGVNDPDRDLEPKEEEEV